MNDLVGYQLFQLWVGVILLEMCSKFFMFIHEAIYADDGIGATGVLGFGDGTTATSLNAIAAMNCGVRADSRSGHSHSHDAQCWRCAAECCSWGS